MVEGGAKCLKYSLFFFNLLFLLCGLALIIVGAVVQVQASNYSNEAGSAGIFLIVIGCIIFVVCFFGCVGAFNENHCMVVTFGVLLLLILICEIAAVIVGFVLKNKMEAFITDEFTKNMNQYNPDHPDHLATKAFDAAQKDLKCCGTTGPMSWNASDIMRNTSSVPDSCCKNYTVNCGYRNYYRPSLFYEEGCVEVIKDVLMGFLVVVGVVAIVVAIIQILGIIFAFCLAHSLKKDYKVV